MIAPIPAPGNPFQGPQEDQSNLIIRSYTGVTSYFGLTVRHNYVFLISPRYKAGPKPPDLVCSLVRNTGSRLLRSVSRVLPRTLGKNRKTGVNSCERV
jgi:hypothetical protein